MEIFATLSGIVVSVINNSNLEIALIAITGTEASWSVKDESLKLTKVKIFF